MIRVLNNAAEYSTNLRGRASAMSAALVDAINDVSKKMQARILSRPGSPASAEHRKKGWLANSVRLIPAQTAGETVSGGVEGAGGDAWYGRLFEEGTATSYLIMPAAKKALAFEMHGQAMVLHAVVHPPFDAAKLAFMHPVYEEMEDEIKAEIQEAAISVLRGEV
jgi:hypothetical protein